MRSWKGMRPKTLAVRLLCIVMAIAGIVQLDACVMRHDEPKPLSATSGGDGGAGTGTEQNNEDPRLLVQRGATITTGANAHPFRLRFDEAGASVVRAGDGQRTTLGLARIGRAERINAFARVDAARLVEGAPRGAKRTAKATTTTATTAARPATSLNHVVYRTDDVEEWFEPTLLGLEHGFTVRAPPVAGSGELVFDIGIGDGLEARSSRARAAIDLVRSGDGAPLFRYGELTAFDAKGRGLEARLEARGLAGIRIVVVDRGATYPIVVDPLLWALQSKLTLLGAKQGDLFGAAVGVSGDTIIVGANGRDQFRGAVGLFTKKGTSWAQEKLFPYTDAAPVSGDLGVSVAIDGDYALLGSNHAATAIRRSNGAWSVEQLIEAEYIAPPPFGAPVAISGNTAVLSVSQTNAVLAPDGGGVIDGGPDGGPPAEGGLFIYEYGAAGWRLQQVFRYPYRFPGHLYGNPAISGDTIAVGSGLEIFVYHRDAGVWSLEARIQDPLGAVRTFAGFFGYLTKIQADRIIAINGNFNASAFVRQNGAWTYEQELVSPPISGGFGSIAYFESDLFFGDSARYTTGAVLRYRRVAGAWVLEEEIIPPDVTTSTGFGTSVAAAKDIAVVGASLQGAFFGSAYVYERKSSLGETCASGAACASGFCIDGVCCDTACGDGDPTDCLACDGATTRGTCSAAARGIVCRRSTNACDTSETCDGVSSICPADLSLANGEACDGGRCVAGACLAAATSPSGASPPVSAPVSAPAEGCGISPAPTSCPTTILVGIVALVLARRRKQRASPNILILILVIVGLLYTGEAHAGLTWRERTSVVSSKPQAGASFGFNVSVAGDLLVAASRGASAPLALYRRSGSGWTKDVDLAPAESLTAFARYGNAIALGSDTLVVGAPYARDIAGRVYVFERKSGVWVQTATLATDVPLGEFGTSVALDGDTLVVGAIGEDNVGFFGRGAVYVFTREGSAWTRRARIQLDPPVRAFGSRIALQGTNLVVAGTSCDVDGDFGGATVHFFSGAGDTWTRELSLDDPARSRLGCDLAMDGDTIAIGSPFPTTSGTPLASVHLFKRTNGAWTFAQQLASSDVAPSDRFGLALRLHGDRLAVGAPGAKGGTGSAYLFERVNGSFVETKRFTASDGASDDEFGTSVDFTANQLVVGAPERKLGTGAVYNYFLGLEGDACTSGDVCASGFCVDGVCCEDACGGGDTHDCIACSVAGGAKTNGVCGSTRTVCREKRPGDECDEADLCDGESRTCPADRSAPNGTRCANGAGVCGGGQCLPLTNTNVVDAGAPSASPVEQDPGCTQSMSGTRGALVVPSAIGALFVLLAARRRQRS